MEKLKITSGKWGRSRPLNNVQAREGCPKAELYPICIDIGGHDAGVWVWGDKDEEHNAIVDLIAEAGTVANETGLTPRQLLEQRNELLEELKTAHRFCNKLMKKLPDSEWKNALVAGVVHMDQAIKKTTT